MTQQEFEKLLGSKVTEIQYEIIERVYTYHPAIKDVGGKEQIVTLYKIGGMRIMKDMLPTAVNAKIREDEINSVSRLLDNLKADYEEFKQGNKDS